MAWWVYFIIRSVVTGVFFIAGGFCHLVLALLFIPAGFMLVLQGAPVTLKYWPWEDHKKSEPKPSIPLGWKDADHEDYGGTDGSLR